MDVRVEFNAKNESDTFDYTILDNLKRSKCFQCGKSRMYFCYTCCLPMYELQGKLPKVQLPVNVDILKHASEKDGKSTAVHAVLLSPEHVTMYTYPIIPDYDKHKVIVIYPSITSVTFKDIASRYKNQNTKPQPTRPVTPTLSSIHIRLDNNPERRESIHDKNKQRFSDSLTSHSANTKQSALKSDNPENVIQDGEKNTRRKFVKISGQVEEPVSRADWMLNATACLPFDRVIFIDGTWSQVKKIFNDDRIQGIVSVELTDEETRFWRPQTGHPSSHLSTIEAVHSTFTSIHQHFLSDTPYSGQYDALLYFFNYFSHKVSMKQGFKRSCPTDRGQDDVNVPAVSE